MKRSQDDIGKTLDHLLSRHNNPSTERMGSAIERVEEKLRFAGDDVVEHAAPSRDFVRVWFAAAAAFVFVVGLSIVVKTFVWTGDAFAAVESGSGPVSKVSGGKTEIVKAGGRVAAGEILRTQEGNSSITVAGARVEMRPQSEIALEPVDDGIRVQLNKGSVVINAQESDGQLYVKTKDTLVSAKEGVFLVAAEAGGSRVSVMQGEVRAQQGREEKTLAAGEQIAPESRAKVRLDTAFSRITEDEVLVRTTLGLPYSLFTFKDDLGGQVRRAAGRIEGRVTDLTGRTAQRIDETFEITAPTNAFDPFAISLFQKTLYLKPKLYRLFVLYSDANGGPIGSIDTRLEVPRFSADKLSVSSLTIADRIEPAPLNLPSSFRIGSLIVRPSMNGFRRDQDLNLYQQVYAVSSSLPLYMETLITLDGREIKRVAEQLERSPNITVTRRIPLADFSSGTYTLQTAYTDAASGERVVSTGQFTVR